MTDRVLFVDDEPNVLDALRRLLRKQYTFDTAVGGEEALRLLGEHQYAVIVSDMRMPGMAGDEFLAKAHINQPDAVQMILSGQADLSSTVSAVNEGAIFRFLMKPVDKEVLTNAVDGAMRQYNLVQAERQLLEETLSGAVRALTDVLGLVSPSATRRTNHMTDLVARIAPASGLRDDWQIRLAALLSAVGYAAVPAEVVERSDAGSQLSAAEADMISRHPHVAKQLLGRIPRLEGVSGIISAQAGVDAAPPGLEAHVQVLDLATRVTDGLLRGHELAAIVDGLATGDEFPAELLATLGETSTGPDTVVEELQLTDFREGMWLRSDVFSDNNVMLASANTCLTGALLERLRNYARSTGVRQPVLVEFERVGDDHETRP